MPWGVAAAVVGAAGAAYSADQAADAQTGAAGAARALSQAQYNDTRNRNEPFYFSGTDALSRLTQRIPELTAAYDPSKLMDSPGYQFGLSEGQKALERSLAARGAGGGGAAMKAALRFGTDYGTSKLNDAFSRDQTSKQQIYNQLMGLTGIGQASANNTAAAGQQYAAQGGAALIGAGNAQAASQIAQGNIWGNLLNQGASMYERRQQGGGAGGSSFGATPNAIGYGTGGTSGYIVPGGYDAGVGGVGAGGSPDGYWADGGPVLVDELPPPRREPKVGTKGPVRGGTGGGLSREAIRAALDQASAPAAPAKSGLAALPTNPVTNPGGLRKAQMQELGLKGGGEVDGPGGPKDDAIRARLSDGEHVWDAEAVTALGEGDNARGQEILNAMREGVKREHAKGKRKGARRG